MDAVSAVEVNVTATQISLDQNDFFKNYLELLLISRLIEI